MIPIYFVGGTHGHYLEFVLNTVVAKIPVDTPLPFNSNGAAHSKHYLETPVFKAVEGVKSDFQGSIVVIQAQHEDLLPWLCISYLRTGDFGVDPDMLEINTWNKMNNRDYIPVREHIKKHFFKDGQQFDQEHPDCPRGILREHFKLSFHNTNSMPNIVNNVPADANMFVFNYGDFYNFKNFCRSVKHLTSWWDSTTKIDFDKLSWLHQEFLSRQPFYNIRTRCDNTVEDILSGQQFRLPQLNIMQEAYIDYKIEQQTGRQLPVDNDKWFKHSSDIQHLLKEDGLQ